MNRMWRDLIKGNIYVGKCMQANYDVNIDGQTYRRLLKVFLPKLYAL